MENPNGYVEDPAAHRGLVFRLRLQLEITEAVFAWSASLSERSIPKRVELAGKVFRERVQGINANVRKPRTQLCRLVQPQSALNAASAAHAIFALAAQRAASVRGTGSFAVAFVDALSELEPEQVGATAAGCAQESPGA